MNHKNFRQIIFSYFWNRINYLRKFQKKNFKWQTLSNFFEILKISFNSFILMQSKLIVGIISISQIQCFNKYQHLAEETNGLWISSVPSQFILKAIKLSYFYQSH